MSGKSQRCAVSAISFLFLSALIGGHAYAQSVHTDRGRTITPRLTEVAQTDAPTEGGAAVISLVEVDPPEGVVVDVVQDRRWFEIRLKNWAPALLGQWQVSIDPASFIPNAAGSIAPAQKPCCSDEWCEHAFGTGATCNTSLGLCRPGFQDATRYNWSFDTPSGPIASPYLTFTGTTTNVGSVADDGMERYGGTLVIDPSYVAIEVPSSFPIDFLPPPDTFLLDQSAGQIPLLATESGVLALVGGKCCIPSSGTCQDGITQAACTIQGGLWDNYSDCSIGCLLCSSGVCTDLDICTTSVSPHLNIRV